MQELSSKRNELDEAQEGLQEILDSINDLWNSTNQLTCAAVFIDTVLSIDFRFCFYYFNVLKKLIDPCLRVAIFTL